MFKLYKSTLLFITLGLAACSDPNLQSYTIVNDKSLAPYKRTIDIQLESRASEADLMAIAEKVKSLDSKSYDRTFISYEIKGEPSDDIGMSYATSHFDPDVAIRFFGISQKEQITLWANIDKLKSQSIKGKILGTWYNYGRPGSVYMIEQNDEGFIFHHVYPKETTKKDDWGPTSEVVTAKWDGDAIKFFRSCCGENEWYKHFPNGELRFQSNLGSDRLLPKATRP